MRRLGYYYVVIINEIMVLGRDLLMAVNLDRRKEDGIVVWMGLIDKF